MGKRWTLIIKKVEGTLQKRERRRTNKAALIVQKNDLKSQRTGKKRSLEGFVY